MNIKQHPVLNFLVIALLLALFAKSQVQAIDADLAEMLVEMNARFRNVEVELLEWPAELQEELGGMTELALVTRPVEKKKNTTKTGGKRLPLLINLHGGGKRWWDQSLPERLATAAENGMKRGYDLAELSGKEMVVLDPQTAERWNADSLDTMLEYVLKEFPDVDEDRVYVMGYSAGGGATWRWINQSMDRFAAASPNGFRGGSRNDDATKLAGLPIWAMAGGEDGRNPEGIQNMVRRLEAAENENVRLTIFEGADHSAGGVAVYNTTELVDWMLGFRLPRDTFPKSSPPTATPTASPSQTRRPTSSPSSTIRPSTNRPSTIRPTSSTTSSALGKPSDANTIAPVSLFELGLGPSSASALTSHWLLGRAVSLFAAWYLM